ncbi:MAG: DUF2007 domain-containing protein [Acidobacteria bacterium]|nr:DUF2007 domain-containing protein [Acidobacteriota bacterium]
MTKDMVTVFIAAGETEAQQVRSFLEANGIEVLERGEALRFTHGFTMDGLGQVELQVASGMADRAKELLRLADEGDFRLETDDPVPGDSALD